MNYEKLYKEALERAKSKIENDKGHVLYEDDIKEIFPELVESEDEKIRKWIRKELESKYVVDNIVNNRMADKAFAWLEKQGEQKPTDNVEPKFKIGEWVVFIKTGSAYQVEKIENYEYTLRHIFGGSVCLSFSNEELIREWTIQDAKECDMYMVDIMQIESLSYLIKCLIKALNVPNIYPFITPIDNSLILTFRQINRDTMCFK